MALNSLKMVRKKDCLRILIPVDLQFLTLLVYHIHDFLSGFIESRKVIFKIQLAVDEIVTNIIKYGRHSHPEPDISILICVGKRFIKLVIRDKAKSFNPLEFDLPDIAERKKQREKGGLGIYLTRTVMDRISYMYDNGNVLTMKIFRKNSVSQM